MRNSHLSLTILILIIAPFFLNAQEIQQIGFTETEGIRGVHVVGDYAYIGAQTDGLGVVDISDPEHPSSVGYWDNPRSAACGVQLYGNYVFVANNDQGLYSVDVSDPTDPDQDGHVSLPGVATNLFVLDDIAYVSNEEYGLRIIDVSDPRDLRAIGVYDSPSYCRGVYVVGDLAYVADGREGLRIVNVSNPRDPEEIGAVDSPGFSWNVFVLGDYAYLADDDAGLRIINVADPENPHEVGDCDVPGNVYTVQVIGDFAYIAGYNAGFRVIDISNPEEPEVVGYNNQDYTRCAYVVGDYAYVGSDLGLHIYDCSTWQEERSNIAVNSDALNFGEVRVSEESEMILTISNEGNADLHVTDISIEGDYFTTDFRDEIVVQPEGSHELTVTFAPQTDGRHHAVMTLVSDDPYEGQYEVTLDGSGLRGVCLILEGNEMGVFVEGDLAYVASETAGMRVIDISDPLNPHEIGFWDNPRDGAYDVFYHDGFAYLANNDMGLYTIDMQDPEDPDQDGWIDTPDLARGVFVSGNYAYVADQQSGLRIIDVSDPRNPVESGALDTESAARKVFVVGNLAYVADNRNGLLIVDVSDPENPEIIGAEDTPDIAWDVHVVGNYAYVADGEAGLRIINVSDPTRPHEVGSYDDIRDAQGLYVIENIAYVADRRGDGLFVINVSDSQNPELVDCFYTGGSDAEVFVSGDFAYVADPERGLMILELNLDFYNAPSIAVTPNAIDFGEVEIGTVFSENMTIRNNGNEALIIFDMVTGDEQFTTSFAGEFEIEPGASSEITVNFSPAAEENIESTLIITSNDEDNNEIRIQLEGVGVRPEVPGLRYFTDITETDANHSLLILALSQDEEAVPTGWEVGVLTPDGVLAGAGVWVQDERMGISVWADDAETENIVEGFSAGETMQFRLWDDTEDQEYVAQAEIVEGSIDWESNGFSAIRLSSVSLGVDLMLQLRQGWNMISINIIPGQDMWEAADGPDIILMTEQLRIDEDNHLINLMKDQFGHFYYPARDFNNIPFWNSTEGYQIKMNEDAEAVWSGMPIDAQGDIPLTEGWNLVAYYPTFMLDADAPDLYVLSTIIDHVLIAKNERGQFMLPRFNFSNMTPWHEGKGYQIKVDEDIILNYPEAEDEIQSAVGDVSGSQAGTAWSPVLSTGGNMSILIADINGYEASEGDQLAAVSADGRIVGVGSLSARGDCGLAVWGDDPSTDVKDGLRKGEAFSLMLWDSGLEEQRDLSVASVIEGKGLTYETDGFTSVSMISEIVTPTDFYLREAYPNPFNSTTKIVFGLSAASDVDISVYDISGRRMASLINEHRSSGQYTTVWNAPEVAAGVYIVRMQAGDWQDSRKVTLLR